VNDIKDGGEYRCKCGLFRDLSLIEFSPVVIQF